MHACGSSEGDVSLSVHNAVLYLARHQDCGAQGSEQGEFALCVPFGISFDSSFLQVDPINTYHLDSELMPILRGSHRYAASPHG